MSDIRVINTKTKKIVSKEYNLDNIKDIISNDTFNLLGIKKISDDLLISENLIDGLVCEIIGVDENFRLTVIEFRRDKYSYLIKKGLYILDYIKKHFSIVKIKLKDYLDEKTYSNISDFPRLIVIGEDFSNEDFSSINQMPYEIDLVKAYTIDNYLIINKMYQSYNCNLNNLDIKNINLKKLFNNLHEDVLSLGSDITVNNSNNLITYRRIKSFLIIYIDEELDIYLLENNKMVKIVINSNSDIDNIMDRIKEIYDES